MNHICSICGRKRECSADDYTECGFPEKYRMNCVDENNHFIHEQEYLKLKIEGKK